MGVRAKSIAAKEGKERKNVRRLTFGVRRLAKGNSSIRILRVGLVARESSKVPGQKSWFLSLEVDIVNSAYRIILTLALGSGRNHYRFVPVVRHDSGSRQ